LRARPSAQARALGESAPLFAALGDEIRLGIVLRLCAGGPLSITRLTEGFAVTRQGISKHLRVMEEVGLVLESRQGRESVWALQPGRLKEARRHLDAISKEWDDALLRLKKFVER
jgi:DNA-binding transcriptional ArsR family regulator